MKSFVILLGVFVFSSTVFNEASGASAGEIPIPDIVRAKNHIQACFLKAEKEWQVPQLLLKAIALMETGGYHNEPDHAESDLHGHRHPNFYGIMALRNDPILGFTLREGARLLQREEQEIKRDPCLNILAAAAVINKNSKGSQGEKPESYLDGLLHYWSFKNIEEAEKSIQELSYHIKNGGNQRIFLHKSPSEGARLLQAFARKKQRFGTPFAFHAEKIQPVNGGAEYPHAEWDPSPNFEPGNENRYIVIHTTEGGFNGATAWLKNPASEVSSHYIIRKRDGYVKQLVRESDQAYHARCWNEFAIGIETEGYSGDSSNFTNTLYSAIARLVTYLRSKHGIPANRLHIIGHNFGQSGFIDQTDLSNCNDHSDPGKYFNWNQFMRLIGGSDYFRNPSYSENHHSRSGGG